MPRRTGRFCRSRSGDTSGRAPTRTLTSPATGSLPRSAFSPDHPRTPSRTSERTPRSPRSRFGLVSHRGPDATSWRVRRHQAAARLAILPVGGDFFHSSRPGRPIINSDRISRRAALARARGRAATGQLRPANLTGWSPRGQRSPPDLCPFLFSPSTDRRPARSCQPDALPTPSGGCPSASSRTAGVAVAGGHGAESRRGDTGAPPWRTWRTRASAAWNRSFRTR
jgi:hypothetical protein